MPLTSSPQRHTRIALAAAAACTALLAAGCTSDSTEAGDSTVSASAPKAGGGSTSEPPTSAEPSPGTPQQSEPRSDGGQSTPQPDGLVAWCPTDSLSASVRGLSPGAGNRYAALVLTNTGDTTCRTKGWPGLQFVDGGGSGLPTDNVRDREQAAQEVTLRPGAHAWSRLHWAVVPGEGDDGPCPAPGSLRVIPPDQRTATEADWSQGEVCGAGHVTAAALRAGTGPR
ncbi:DUF4232 domain-containing protein [Streptomyces sulphureus]|uniref:DUF4232 domain-containing protein n=1 Tax=Streptomyces sulphureus TaxID=47758 RepID=UPI00037AC814|nr:DUF4232 domain-containing protein [Streptomyces sulphureus]